MRFRTKRSRSTPATVRIGLRLVLLAVLIRIGLIASSLVAPGLPADAAAQVPVRLPENTGLGVAWALLRIGLIPVALVARFFARRRSQIGAVVVAGYCLTRLGQMVFLPTVLGSRLPLLGQFAVAGLYVATIACLASPSSRAWFQAKVDVCVT